jgi:hypothetical protein
MLRFKHKEVPANLTQFPPLFHKKDGINHVSCVKKLKDLARIGDQIYTFDRNSAVSTLIRKVDRGMWSHVALIDENKNIYELTTSGMRTSDFSSLNNPTLDIGLYRMRNDNENEDEDEEKHREIILEMKRESQRHQIKYSWVKVFLIYLKRRFDLPIPIPFPADMMYMNLLELISYT